MVWRSGCISSLCLWKQQFKKDRVCLSFVFLQMDGQPAPFGGKDVGAKMSFASHKQVRRVLDLPLLQWVSWRPESFCVCWLVGVSDAFFFRIHSVP